jgi:hypothetical protein
VPIYAIGLGTELDEINLEKVATNSGALYLSATDPAELKRLYDSIGKQLAGQYTIYYTSNLPSDGLEHRVQLKFGATTSTKSFVPPARVAAAPPPAPPPTTKKPAEPPADLPNWLPLYPGSKPEGLSIVTDPQTGKRVGSYFFRTSDEIKQVHDFYEDKMTRATWDVSRAPTEVWGGSEAEGRKFEVTPERRGDQVRVRVTFEEKKPGATAATEAKPAELPADLPGWLPLYPDTKPEGLSIVTDPQTGKRIGSYFFRTSDEIKQVHDFYEDKMTQATWDVSREPTQVWGSSKSEGRKFEVTPERRGDQVRVRVTFEEKKPAAAAAPATKPAEPPADLPDWLPLYPGAKPEGLSITTDPQTGKRVGSYFFRTSDEIKQVHDFYEDNMTRATWDVSRAPTEVWGSSEAEGRKFEVTPERRGDETRVRVTFEEKARK